MVKNVFFVSMVAFVGLFSSLLGQASAEPHATKTGFVASAKPAAQVLPDAVVVPERLHRSANLSYKVAGKRYYPQKSIQSFRQEGTASWYGKDFHGRKTSSGERYDMNEMTAAHPTLPIPSYAKVTNLANGKDVIVRINDRGPFHSKRVMDLSYGAAQKLGFVSKGTARVRVEQIVPGQVAAKPAEAIYVTLQQFNNLNAAQGYLKKASSQLSQYNAKTNSLHELSVVREQGRYVVRVGPFKQQQGANRVKNNLLTTL